MPHFYVPPGNIRGDRFYMDPDESDHLARVLRKKSGDRIGVFDGENRAWEAVLETVTARRVEGRLEGRVSAAPEKYRLRLWQGLPKGDKMDWIVEKGTELGVAEFLPVVTERSLSGLDKRADAKTARWNRIARTAAQQCGRLTVPKVLPPQELAMALRSLSAGEGAWIPWEGESARPFSTALREFRAGRSGAPTLNVIIGPEGGFSPAEVEAAKKAGAVPVSLGPRILRTETAALFAASALLYEFGLA